MSKEHWYAPFKGKFDVLSQGPEEGPFVCVSFNASYLPFVTGALKALFQRRMWRGSDADIDVMTMKIHQLVYMFGAARLCREPQNTIEEWEEMASLCESLRYQDGKLQALCCGEWTDIDGQPVNGDHGQPGDGLPQPQPGGPCQSYFGRIGVRDTWVLPTLVDTGDVLTFDSINGAGTANGISWWCPDGHIFFGGLCLGVPSPLAGDPAPLLNDMALVVKIGSTFYDATAGPITVPGGISGAQVYVRVNGVFGADSGGEYSWNVEVCNNTDPGWTSVLDFRLHDYAAFRVALLGTWALGQGYAGASNGFEPYCIQPQFIIDPFTLTQFALEYTCSAHSGAGDGVGLYVHNVFNGYFGGLTPCVNGSPSVKVGAGNTVGDVGLQPTVNSGAAGSQVYMTKLTLEGKGVKPSQLP